MPSSDLTITIANKNYSSWSLRAWLALAHVGIAFDEVLVPLDEPGTKDAILVHSPSGRVPALRHGDVVVWDSLAIGEYLAEVFPDAKLWPDDRAARAVARAVSAEMHSGFMALRQHMPMNLRARLPGMGRTPQSLVDIERVVRLWNDCRARFGEGSGAARTPGPFLFGRFSIADAMYAPVVARFATYDVALDDVCAKYAAAVLALPAFVRWMKDAEREPQVVAPDEYPRYRY